MVDEVVLVDGHSIDDTVAVAQMLRPDIRVVLQNASGKGNALACGFAAATGDIIVMLDADGSTDPARSRASSARCSTAATTRRFPLPRRRWQPRSHAPAQLRQPRLTAIVNLLFRTPYTDLTYGYNAFWTDCLKHLQVNRGGFEGEVLIHVRAGRAKLKIREVPSMEHERIFGESKLNAMRDGVRILRMILRERMAIRARVKVQSDAVQLHSSS